MENLVYTTDYLLLIDKEAEIKEGDYIECELEIFKPLSGIREYYKRISENKPTVKWDKIIAYYPLTKEAKELDLPLLPNPSKGENDIEKLAKEYIGMDSSKEWSPDEDYYNPKNKEYHSFIAGYNAAQTKQFSLEDMEKAIEMAREYNFVQFTNGETEDKYTEEEIIQSLSTQQLPKEFIPEKIWINSKGEKGNKFSDVALFEESINHYVAVSKLKTTTNPEGRQELVGVYKN